MFEEMVLEGHFELESMLQNLIRRTHFLSARLVFMRAHSILIFTCTSLQGFVTDPLIMWHASLRRIIMCLHRIIMQQVHIVLSVCARHSLLGETLHDVLLTLLE